MHQCSIGFVLWSVRSWFKTGKAWTLDLLMENYDVSLSQRVGIHNYYTNDHIITCNRCKSWKFYSFVRWIIWWQVTSDEDAWRPLIRNGITSICILWFCCDILSCGMSWNIWNWLLKNISRPGSCRWQPTTCVRRKNGKHALFSKHYKHCKLSSME